MSLEIEIKRGANSWAFFPIAFNILLTIGVGIISVLNIFWVYKVVLFIISAVTFFYLSFFNSWFRNQIVGLMMKSQQKKEIFKH